MSSAIISTFRWSSEDCGLTSSEKSTLVDVASVLQTRPISNPMGDLYRRKEVIVLPNGFSVALPRTVVIARDLFLVSLKVPVATPNMICSQQKNMKLAIDLFTGDAYLKKRCNSPEEYLLIKYIWGLTHVKGIPEEELGVPVIAYVSSKMRYFEKRLTPLLDYFPMRGSGWWPPRLERINEKIDLPSLARIKQIVQRFHGLVLHPAVLVEVGGKRFAPLPPIQCWLGDINAKNCVVQKLESGSLAPKLIDYGQAMNLQSLAGSEGWHDPYVIAESVNGRPIVDRVAYNHRFAAKQDLWQLALLIGSLARHTLSQYGGYIFSCFRSVVDSMDVCDGGVSYARILTQEAIDRELESFLRFATDRALWEEVRGWLRADPESRIPLVQRPNIPPLPEPTPVSNEPLRLDHIRRIPVWGLEEKIREIHKKLPSGMSGPRPCRGYAPNQPIQHPGGTFTLPQDIFVYSDFALYGVPALKELPFPRLLNLTTGWAYLKKRISSNEEEVWVRYLSEQKGLAFAEVLAVHSHSGQRSYFEKIYRPLTDWVGMGTHLRTFAPLHNSLKLLHSLRCEKARLVEQATPAEDPIPAWHGSIHPDHCVMDTDAEEPVLLFTNYTRFVNVTAPQFNIGWTPPECIIDKTKRELRSGQAKDLWELGLLFASIALRRTFEGERPLPPLQCILSRVTGDDDSAIKALTQKEIDQELDAIRESQDLPMRPLWSLIKTWLRIQPQERAPLGIFPDECSN